MNIHAGGLVIVATVGLFGTGPVWSAHPDAAAASLETPVEAQGKPLDLGDEPIAYIGHGAMFDRAGKEIAFTPGFAVQAQDYYLSTLLKSAGEDQRRAHEERRKALLDARTWDAPTMFFIKAALIERLINDMQPAKGGALLGKNALLKQKYLVRFDPPPSLKQLLAENGMR